MLKPLWVATLLAAGAVALGLPERREAPKTPAPGMIYTYPERIPLRNGGFFTSERGMIFVPINRSDPKSGVIAVEFYRFRASGARKRPPVFFLHGGPGFRGLPEQLQRTGTFESRWRSYLDIDRSDHAPQPDRRTRRAGQHRRRKRHALPARRRDGADPDKHDTKQLHPDDHVRDDGALRQQS